MAKIEIKDRPEELEKISTFLTNNYIEYQIIDDYGNHCKEDGEKYQKLMDQNK